MAAAWRAQIGRTSGSSVPHDLDCSDAARMSAPDLSSLPTLPSELAADPSIDVSALLGGDAPLIFELTLRHGESTTQRPDQGLNPDTGGLV